MGEQPSPKDNRGLAACDFNNQKTLHLSAFHDKASCGHSQRGHLARRVLRVSPLFGIPIVMEMKLHASLAQESLPPHKAGPGAQTARLEGLQRVPWKFDI